MKIALVFTLVIVAVERNSAADDVDYQRDIKPLFAEKCSVCHGALMQESGLRLDAGALIRKGGDGGPVVVPGKAAESTLILKVTAEDVDERMPPEGEGAPLNPQQVAMLTQWINAGAKIPVDEPIPVNPREHWAFQIPVRPSVPEVDDPRWAHPIDAFISREHKRLGLTPVETADAHTLLRRLYLGLIGLPPTREQMRSFVDDDPPQAWRNAVDSLLDNPHYGERWGRHWMDVWRYSDWDGYKEQLRGSQRHIWHWRDWIIQSLNDDKGYDRMIVEMLAADEVDPDNAAALPATGFLARNYHKSNRNIWLDATVEHTSKAFLGITLNCARCHDHKFDPIPQTAYYQFRAIFEPHDVRTDQIAGQPDVAKDGIPRAYDADLKATTYLFRRGNEKHPDKENPISPGVPDFLGGKFDIQPIRLPVNAFYPSLRDDRITERLAKVEENVTKSKNALAAAKSSQPEADLSHLELKMAVAKLRLDSLKARLAADRAKHAGNDETLAARLAATAAAAERKLIAEQAKLAVDEKEAALRAAESSNEKDAKKKQSAVGQAKKALADAKKQQKTAEAALAKADGKYTPLGKVYPRTSSGRRSALARWVANTENPLTARVAVNQIWMRHFGAPLVDGVFDFGLRSPRPRHADLLDWLAVELMENNWSMKHLHRLIATSRTWRLASSAGNSSEYAANQRIDRDNHYLWRMNVRRLDAEIVRDSVLAVSGQLDVSFGGPDIDFRQGETSRRRSVYLRHAYEKQMTMLVLFDAASPTECYRRSESIVPQQALALSNSSLTLSQSRLASRQLWKEIAANGKDQDARFVRAAFLQILSRPPTEKELAACIDFIRVQSNTLTDTSKLGTFVGGSAPKVKPAADPHQRALENLVHVLMNHNDFVTVR